MSTTQIPTYVPMDNLPAPTASTSTTGFTDVSGEVWVAKSTVNSGAWAKARDVLHCQYNRTAAYTLSGLAVMAHDSLVFDTYGLYNSSTGVVTFPIGGLWRLVNVITVQGNSTNQVAVSAAWQSGGATSSSNNGNQGGDITAICDWTQRFASSATMSTAASGTGSVRTPALGLTSTWMEVHWIAP